MPPWPSPSTSPTSAHICVLLLLRESFLNFTSPILTPPILQSYISLDPVKIDPTTLRICATSNTGNISSSSSPCALGFLQSIKIQQSPPPHVPSSAPIVASLPLFTSSGEATWHLHNPTPSLGLASPRWSLHTMPCHFSSLLSPRRSSFASYLPPITSPAAVQRLLPSASSSHDQFSTNLLLSSLCCHHRFDHLLHLSISTITYLSSTTAVDHGPKLIFGKQWSTSSMPAIQHDKFSLLIELKLLDFITYPQCL